MTSLRRVLFVIVWIAANASMAHAQARDTTPTAMGRDAAEDESVALYFLAGMLGGSGIGITATHYLRADQQETPYRPAIAGLAIVIGTGVSIEFIGESAPNPQLDATGTTAYQQAFRDRVRDRRRNALAFGTIAGIATGAIVHVLLSRAAA